LSFLSGLVLGLAMILPIGPQNVFVLTQGLEGRLGRGLLAALVAGLCDTLLILAGAAGLSALFTAVPWLRLVLLLTGVAFLLGLGLAWLRAPAAPEPVAPAGGSTLSLLATGVAVSWGNPHAILDTVAVLGSAVAAQLPAARVPFAAGAISASWLFFLTLALAGSLLGRFVTPGAQRWIRRSSGVMMLTFAIILGREALRLL